MKSDHTVLATALAYNTLKKAGDMNDEKLLGMPVLTLPAKLMPEGAKLIVVSAELAKSIKENQRNGIKRKY